MKICYSLGAQGVFEAMVLTPKIQNFHRLAIWFGATVCIIFSLPDSKLVVAALLTIYSPWLSGGSGRLAGHRKNVSRSSSPWLFSFLGFQHSFSSPPDPENLSLFLKPNIHSTCPKSAHLHGVHLNIRDSVDTGK